MRLNHDKRRIAAAAAALALTLPVSGFAAGFPDVPAGHWAEAAIAQAAEAGIMQGDENGQFGLGRQVTRAEFSVMLVRLMGWETSGTVSEITDISADDWYAAAVSALWEHGAAEGGAFRPGDPITREEMAVMLVRALGYDSLAETAGPASFPDTGAYPGHIALANGFGIINGREDGTFDPYGSALREESAAMMMRLRDRYTHTLDWLHGFYAISSWSQKDMGGRMDSVSFGWSRLEYSPEKGVWLNTTGENGNDWRIPEGSQEALDYFAQKEIPGNLAVLMNTSQTITGGAGENACEAALLDRERREAAAAAIAAEARNYSGVTIDFEGMKGEALKQGLNQFLIQLRGLLGEKALYVAVHPVMDGAYFDAYDYRTIGETADRVILMAHDYAALTMPDNLREAGFTDTPVTPFPAVYTALRAICDPETGVAERSKIALAVSLGNTAAWQLSDGKTVNAEAIHPSMETVQKRLKQADTQIIYSPSYRNPRAIYTDDAGCQAVLWYEDARSIADKIRLARMFGVNGLSIWRLGIIPNDNTDGICYDIWDTIENER